MGDKQLAKEIMYDMRQAELAKENAVPFAAPQQAAQQGTQRSPVVQQAAASAQPAPAVQMHADSPKAGTLHKHRQSSLRRSSGAVMSLYQCYGGLQLCTLTGWQTSQVQKMVC